MNTQKDHYWHVLDTKNMAVFGGMASTEQKTKSQCLEWISEQANPKEYRVAPCIDLGYLPD